MGKVYAAQHPRLPRQDALKILNPGLSNDPMFRGRFEREGQLAASLDHPHIVPVYDCGSDQDRLWLSMRLINGPTAASELLAAGAGGLPPERVIQICLPVAHALDFAHSRNLQHRDVKPENILLDISGTVLHPLLSDFGIARVFGDTSLSSTGMVIGTLDYSPPEHLNGEPTDGRSDQYSLACTAAHLLTGVKPFTATQPSAIMLKHISGERPRLTRFREDLPAAVDEVFVQALAIKPDDRFPSCADFILALSDAVQSTVTAKIPPRPTAPPTVITSPGGQMPSNYDATQIGDRVSGHRAAAPSGPHDTLGGRSAPARPSVPLQGPNGRPMGYGPPPGMGHPPARGVSSPPPVPPTDGVGYRQSPRPSRPDPSRTVPILIGMIVVLLVVTVGVVALLLSGGSDDKSNSVAAADVSESHSTTSTGTTTTSSPPPRQLYDILDTNRRALDPCRLPPTLLAAGGMNTALKTFPPQPEILLCEGTFSGAPAPEILMGGYVADSPTARWVIQQYNRGQPVSDLPAGWRRYDATDREAPVTRCKYGYVSRTSPQYAFEITVIRTPETGGFGARARAAACNRLGEVARAIDPAMPQ
jgi:serine/threonine-protein kinase